MRIWDLNPSLLCVKHLVAEHRELHGLWNILTKHGGKGGYSKHPETLRWVGKEKALYLRHELLVQEMLSRGYSHQSPLDSALAVGSDVQELLITPLQEQRLLLSGKPCACFEE